MCDLAATTWRKIEGRGDVLSILAVKSIRGLVEAMASVLRSANGGSRWCETAFVSPAVAETFALIFPETTFLCFHRSLKGVIAEGIAAYPWGLGGSPFWPYPGGHPGNNVATIADYWAERTTMLLDFEADHQQSCLRIRYEDLIAGPNYQLGEIFRLIGLESGDPVGAGHHPGSLDATERQDDNSGAPRIPTEQIPLRLMPTVNDLHARLNLKNYL